MLATLTLLLVLGVALGSPLQQNLQMVNIEHLEGATLDKRELKDDLQMINIEDLEGATLDKRELKDDLQMINIEDLEGANVDKRATCDAVYQQHGTIHGVTHSMCQTQVATTSGVTAAEAAAILAKHNTLRENPQTTQTPKQMCRMYWDPDLAKIAQAWAGHCVWAHDEPAAQQIPGYGLAIGQNMADRPSASWDDAVMGWFNEVNFFVFGSGSNTVGKDVGHYTQVVKDTACRVGCGYALCGTRHRYVCNYITGQSDYTNPFVPGTPCTDCKKCHNEKLCDCEGKICLNGGTLDMSDCTCKCVNPNFSGDRCETINCPGTDYNSCGGAGWELDKCVRHYVPFWCPTQCSWCSGSSTGANFVTAPTTAVTGDSGTGDSGTGDSGTGDSGTGDSGTGDSGTGDSGTGDSGTGDSGTGDSGTGDSGTGDSGTGDSGTGDSGTGDSGTGDSGTGDSGTGDSGTGDSGTGDSGTGDSGTGDSGTGDSGTGDSGTGDSGTGDSGTGDSGTGDSGTGDSGTGDSGTGDSGAGDSGTGDSGAGDSGTGDSGGDSGTGDSGTGDSATAVPAGSCATSQGGPGWTPGKTCIFPFHYRGIGFNHCTLLDGGGTPWCYVGQVSNGTHTWGTWGDCVIDSCNGLEPVCHPDAWFCSPSQPYVTDAKCLPYHVIRYNGIAKMIPDWCPNRCGLCD